MFDFLKTSGSIVSVPYYCIRTSLVDAKIRSQGLDTSEKTKQ